MVPNQPIISVLKASNLTEKAYSKYYASVSVDDGPVQKMEYRTDNESHFIMCAYFCVSQDELEVI